MAEGDGPIKRKLQPESVSPEANQAKKYQGSSTPEGRRDAIVKSQVASPKLAPSVALGRNLGSLRIKSRWGWLFFTPSRYLSRFTLGYLAQRFSLRLLGYG